MAITIYTENPSKLLEDIKAGIKNESIVTWEHLVHENESYFTHKPEQWCRKAFLKPKITQSALVLDVIWPKDASPNSEYYAVYEGRFSEMALAHYKAKISSISLT